MSRLRGYLSTTRSVVCIPRPRRIDEFRNPLEFLNGIHDAVEAHGIHFMSTGNIHGNITTHTVCIGAPSGDPTRKGFLIDSPVFNPLFQSANILSQNTIPTRKSLPQDYIDDLESFYYIIAWVSMAYKAPGKIIPTKRFPRVLACWAAEPDTREAALNKETLLRSDGFDCRVPGTALFDVPGLPACVIFEALLGLIHLVLRHLYAEKWANWDVRTQTYTGKLASPKKVYATILDYLRRAAYAMSTSVEPAPGMEAHGEDGEGGEMWWDKLFTET
ncbi:hypothetical protein JR316_0005375 [Psilocybe cubensis]|uniref:Uncharacterized protein n=2 Tax=Psilocybe cubensis TaxID=181762 RepID=A0ACB8H5Y5_PSICU|nr:hypothetical protein JR316_0005375 [Psilocybe cubensis]KAH9483271.1 hypothetical protein JR316_0005375 [Psilocybe cubensis]